MDSEIKPTYRRVRVAEFGKPLIIEELPTPEPQIGEVLIKIAATPINPSDVYAVQGKGANKNVVVPGSEGSGIVVKSGGSERGNALLGKRVATLNRDGNWAEYTIAKDDVVFEINPAADLKKAACSCVNPLTVIGMRRIVKKAGVKAVVHTAGASALGKILIQSLKEDGVTTINVVRKQEQVDQLQKEFPFARFLNSSAPDFKEQLAALSAELGATIAFECVGGAMTGLVVTALPPDSAVYSYGRLSGEGISGIAPEELFYKRKSLHGLWLSTLMSDPSFRAEVPKAVLEMPVHLQTDIHKEFPLEKVNEAVQYAVENASKGKVVLNPELKE